MEQKNLNIFEGVKFGDKFVTKSNKLVIYLKKTIKGRHYLIGDEYLEPIPYDDQGHCFGDYEWDIISRYQEVIDEDYLDKLAADDALRARVLKDANYSIWYLVTETFKAGYRKAMEDFYGTEG